MEFFISGSFLTLFIFVVILVIFYSLIRQQKAIENNREILKALHQEQKHLPNKIDALQNHFNELQVKLLSQLHQDSTRSMTELNQQLQQNLQTSSQLLDRNLSRLTKETSEALLQINQKVEKNLDKNFEKTTQTFTDIVKRLTLIDEAQKKIAHLSEQVVDLQHLLSDKRARGAWGEVQLENILQNMFPKDHYAMQYTFSNGKRVDCLLFLPKPTGNVPVDSKFPLENYRKLHTYAVHETDLKKKAEQQFKLDIKKHIESIAEKYILPPETSDGVIMFIPAEAIFSDLHSHYPDLIELAQQKRVWIVSPTTLMAILTTAKAVLKDEATRKQVDVIKMHLVNLAKDFSRFEKRMQNLTRHIALANQDAIEVNTSAKKITSKFDQIEKVDLDLLEETE